MIKFRMTQPSRHPKNSKDISETEKQQLIKARRGQGLYRSRLDTVETLCRLTGLSQRQHLRASHMKPWRLSTNAEKLDGNNGLLLSPHADHLFDKGFVSFANDGGVLVSSKLDPAVLKARGIDPSKNVGPFNPAQRQYLTFHRELQTLTKPSSRRCGVAPEVRGVSSGTSGRSTSFGTVATANRAGIRDGSTGTSSILTGADAG